MKRPVLRLLVALSTLLMAAAAPAAETAKYPSRVINAFWWGDFAALERLKAEPREPRDAAGLPQADAFSDAIGEVLRPQVGEDRAPEPYAAELVALTRAWMQEHPRSPLAHTLHLRALHRQAWAVRGNGYWNTVPPQARSEFVRLVEASARHAADNAAVLLQDPDAYLALIRIGRDLDWPRERLQAIAEQGLERSPDHDSLYFEVLTTLLPKWGGSAPAVDRFVEQVVERTKARWGLAFYARLYSAASIEEWKFELFNQSGARWPRMRQGFEDLIARYPDPRNTNAFAHFACMARDRDTAGKLMQQIGSAPLLDRWGNRGDLAYQACKRWLASG